MKLKIAFQTLFFGSALLTTVSHAAKMKGEDLTNIIIQGENRLLVHSDIPPVEWNVDIYKEIPSHLKDNSVLGELKPPALKEPPLTLPDKTTSNKTASSWISNVYTQPVVTLTVQPEKEDKKVNWIFRVKDSEGKTFYEVKRRGLVPHEITWDGFGANKNPLRVGYDYTYNLFIVDDAGNPQRHAGHPFNIDAFRYKRGSQVVTTLLPDSLFIDLSTLKVSDLGSRHLTELKDYLRSQYGKKIEVVAYESDPKFALARAKVVRQFVVDSLDFPEEKITAQGLTPKEGQGYRHVDIISK